MSSATFWTSAPSSNCNTLTLIPVSSLKPFKFAAMAVVGAVFSETKLSVVPENCFHISAPGEKDDPDPPHPVAPSSEAPARPAPVILRKLRREYFFRIGKPLPSTLPSRVSARAYVGDIRGVVPLLSSPSIEVGATAVNRLGSSAGTHCFPVFVARDPSVDVP